MEGSERIRVVVVDDHDMVAEALIRVLGDEPDIEVVGRTGSAAGAVDLVETARPDLAIVDYRLPDGNGAATAVRLRAVSPGTQVVMVTGSPQDEVLMAAVEAGCRGFMTKDRAVAELVSAVRIVHGGGAFVPASALADLLPRLSRDYQPTGADLTRREREVLDMLALGLATPDIAARLYLSVNTVRNHVQNLLAKLGAHSKLEAVAVARRHGLLDRSA